MRVNLKKWLAACPPPRRCWRVVKWLALAVMLQFLLLAGWYLYWLLVLFSRSPMYKG